jgi:hypothetical protein
MARMLDIRRFVFFFCNLVVGFSCWFFLLSGRLLLTAGVGAIHVDTRRTP